MYIYHSITKHIALKFHYIKDASWRKRIWCCLLQYWETSCWYFYQDTSKGKIYKKTPKIKKYWIETPYLKLKRNKNNNNLYNTFVGHIFVGKRCSPKNLFLAYLIIVTCSFSLELAKNYWIAEPNRLPAEPSKFPTDISV